jgi:hypothetical protein
MPIFPTDDINPKSLAEIYWQFLRIDRMPNGDVEIESLSYFPELIRVGSSDSHFAHADKSPSAFVSRVRSSIGGGFYPHLHIALHELMNAFQEDAFWSDRKIVPIGHQCDYDILVQSDVKKDDHSGDIISAPFVLSAKKLKESRHTNKAVLNVFKALKKDAPTALQLWGMFPDAFTLRKTAEDTVASLCTPTKGKRSGLKSCDITS